MCTRCGKIGHTIGLCKSEHEERQATKDATKRPDHKLEKLTDPNDSWEVVKFPRYNRAGKGLAQQVGSIFGGKEMGPADQQGPKANGQRLPKRNVEEASMSRAWKNGGRPLTNPTIQEINASNANKCPTTKNLIPNLDKFGKDLAGKIFRFVSTSKAAVDHTLTFKLNVETEKNEKKLASSSTENVHPTVTNNYYDGVDEMTTEVSSVEATSLQNQNNIQAPIIKVWATTTQTSNEQKWRATNTKCQQRTELQFCFCQHYCRWDTKPPRG